MPRNEAKPIKEAFKFIDDAGEIRGLLCRRCNTALGMIGDQHDSVATWCEKALAYLRSAKCRESQTGR